MSNQEEIQDWIKPEIDKWKEDRKEKINDALNMLLDIEEKDPDLLLDRIQEVREGLKLFSEELNKAEEDIKQKRREAVKEKSWADVLQDPEFNLVKVWNPHIFKSIYDYDDHHFESIELGSNFIYLNFDGTNRYENILYFPLDHKDRVLITALAMMDDSFKLTEDQRIKIIERLDSLTGGLDGNPDGEV